MNVRMLMCPSLCTVTSSRWRLLVHIVQQVSNACSADGGTGQPGHSLPAHGAGGERVRLRGDCGLLRPNLSLPRKGNAPGSTLGAQWRDDGGQKDGAAGVYELCLLGTDCVLWSDGHRRLPVDRCQQVEDTAGVFLSPELVCQPVPIRHTDRPVSEGSVFAACKVSVNQRSKQAFANPCSTVMSYLFSLFSLPAWLPFLSTPLHTHSHTHTHTAMVSARNGRNSTK